MPLMTATSSELASTTLSASALTATSLVFLTDTCDILRNTGVSDGIGGFLDNWTLLATYACKPPTPRTPVVERVEADKVTAVGIYEFQLQGDAVLAPGDRLRYRGVLYEVQNRDSQISNLPTISVRARLVE